MPYTVSRIRAKWEENGNNKEILEASEGTYDNRTLTIANPTWKTDNTFSVSSQINAKIAVKVDGIPLGDLGSRGARPKPGAPTFPRMMKLNKRVGNGIELIDK